MKHKMKSILCLALAAVLTLALAACGTTAVQTAFENGGMKLNIPEEYAKLVTVDVPTDGSALFSVSETASIEAAKKQGVDSDGAGWLFSISTTDEQTVQQMVCGDMSGTDIFAKDENGTYYLFNHATDVRMVRESYDNPEELEQWSKLNEWAWSMKDTFIADNSLIADPHTNTDLDIRLAQIAIQGADNYTISTTEYGPMAPNGVDPTQFVEQLRSGVTIAYADGVEDPDGEYVVLAFPEDGVRFDFFKAEGKENYVREVWSEENSALFEITFADGETKATEVMQAWYDALTQSGANVELGYTADDLVGTWAEKIAGRGTIEIEKADDETYNVTVHWGNGAAEMYYWEMTAEPGNGGELHYENCKHTIITFTDETHSTETVVYENGTGTFTLNSANEIMWQDDVENQGADTVFISAM